MILAQDVVDKHGRTLIVTGIPLKREILRLLEKHEISSVFIKEATNSVNRQIQTAESVTSAEIRLKLISSVRDAFTNTNGVGKQLAHLQSAVEDVVHTLAKRENVLLYLNDIDYTSDYLFMHSVNVGLFSIVIGMAMNVPHEELCLLGMGGFLHDFGKTAISSNIIDKRSKLTLTEFNEIKEHASLGYRMLKNDDQLDYRIMFMALQHHERCNGSGYPWGIEKEKIHPLARIVAVADIYDALTTDRVYRSRLSSSASIQMINEGNRIHFDPSVIAAFNKVVIPYHIGNDVTLSHGVKGQVVGLNSSNLVRPLISTNEGVIDLLHQPDLKIISVKYN